MTRILPYSLAIAVFAHASAAADPLSTDQLSPLITGNTLYVTVPAGAPGAPDGGVAPIYYAPDGTAAAQLPAGLKLVGTWRMGDGSYCIDWDNGPKNSCSKLMREESAFVILDAASRDPRGRVFTIATGNPEAL